MDDVLARQHHAVGALGLRGQDEKRESSLVEHLLQSLGVGGRCTLLHCRAVGRV